MPVQVLKYKGSVYGAKLTAAERKAMDIEIQKELAEYDKKHAVELDAMILWVLHEKFGFGPKRLRQFYEGFFGELDALLKRYEMEEGDDLWLCTRKLKDAGVDLAAWHEENKR